MKLYATINSDNGKEVTKSGNEFIHIVVNDENRENIIGLHIERDVNDDGRDTIELVNYKDNYIHMNTAK